MKITKSIILLATVFVFTLFFFNTVIAMELTEEEKKIIQELRDKTGRDCSNPKGFHEKIMCNKDPSYLDKKNLNSEANREAFKAEFMKIFNKIQTYGGTKVGEAD